MQLKLTIQSLEIEVEEMEEKQCHKCGEWWPATDEFFQRSAETGRLRSPCKACIQEQRHETNATTTCCVPGCYQPRKLSRDGVHSYSRCDVHQQELQRGWRKAEPA